MDIHRRTPSPFMIFHITMASIQEGPIISGVSGSVADVTFSRNQFGPTAYARTTPFFPNTTKQQQANAQVRAIVLRWRNLTDAQRLAWNQSGKSGQWSFVNVMGNRYTPSGYQLFMKLNLSLAYFVISFDWPPAKVSMPYLKLDSYTTTNASPTHDSDIRFSGDSFGTGFRLLLFTSSSMSFGRTKPKASFFRWTNNYSFADIQNGLNYKWSYFNVWGMTPNVDRVFIKCELVSLASGERVNVGWLANS